MTDTAATDSTPLVLFALRIAADLVGTCGSDVKTTTHQGLDGQTDSVTLTTDEYAVTVTPRLAGSTTPPYLGMTHPLCEKQGTPYPDTPPPPCTPTPHRGQAHPSTARIHPQHRQGNNHERQRRPATSVGRSLLTRAHALDTANLR